MTILNRPVHLFPAFRLGAMALIAAAALGAGSSSAFAGASEVKALQAALATLPPAGTVTFTNATSQQLLDAFTNVVGQVKFATSKKQGVVAGEALKAAGINARDWQGLKRSPNSWIDRKLVRCSAGQCLYFRCSSGKKQAGGRRNSRWARTTVCE